jgi:hypothetical protein
MMTAMVCFFWVIFLGYIAFIVTLVLPAAYLLPAYAIGAVIATYFGRKGWSIARAWLFRKRAYAFIGQVIARGEEVYTDGDGDKFTEWHIAVDDGRLGWNLMTRSGAFTGLELGRPAHVRVLVQSGQLVAIERVMSDMIQPAP